MKRGKEEGGAWLKLQIGEHEHLSAKWPWLRCKKILRGNSGSDRLRNLAIMDLENEMCGIFGNINSWYHSIYLYLLAQSVFHASSFYGVNTSCTSHFVCCPLD